MSSKVRYILWRGPVSYIGGEAVRMVEAIAGERSKTRPRWKGLMELIEGMSPLLAKGDRLEVYREPRRVRRNRKIYAKVLR